MLIPVIAVIVFICVLSLAMAAISMAPWVPTWKKDLDRVFALADLQSGEMLYDLGCGDGKVVLAAAKRYDITAIGIELAIPLYIVCIVRKLVSRSTNARFIFGNLFTHDLSNANVVYIFGMPKKLQAKLVEKLYTELAPGSRVVSYTFPIEGLEPVSIDKPNEDRVSVYLYQF